MESVMRSQSSVYEAVNNDHEFDYIVPIHDQSGPRVYFTDEPFDSFTLIWLDIQSKGNNLEALRTKNLLLEISKYCLFYDSDTVKLRNRKILLIISDH